jgi:isopentenyl phosphate kinase
VTAERHRLGRGPLGPEQLQGIAETQQSMARLHALIAEALAQAGGLPYSLRPSSWLMATAGIPRAPRVEPLLRALELGLIPLICGDVVLDRSWGASICSTERLFVVLTRALQRYGRRIERAIWLGETEGVWDASGAPIPSIRAAEVAGVLADVGAARGTDVTGGMRHRLESARQLARRGVSSWIVDGRRPGLAESAIAGEPVPGTCVVP